MKKLILSAALAVAAVFGVESAQACIPAITKNTVFAIRSPGKKPIDHKGSNHEHISITLTVPKTEKGVSISVLADASLLATSSKKGEGGQTIYTFNPVASGSSSILVEVRNNKGVTLESYEQKVSIDLAPQTRSVPDGIAIPKGQKAPVFPGGC